MSAIRSLTAANRKTCARSELCRTDSIESDPSVVILTVRSRAEGGWTAAHKFHHPDASSKGASGGLFRGPFPATQAGASESSVESTTLDVLCPIDPWTLHVLRRTFAHQWQRMGIKIAHTEAALNHVSGTRGGIVGVYQTYNYEAELKD